MNLITLRQLKHHVSQDTQYDDAKLERVRRNASAVILDYLKMDVDDTGFDWLDAFGEPTDRVPGVVVAATLSAAGALYENPNGDDDGPKPLSKFVVDLLMRSRIPAMAP